MTGPGAPIGCWPIDGSKEDRGGGGGGEPPVRYGLPDWAGGV